MKIKSILLRCYIKLSERTFGNNKIRYLYKNQKDSDILVVVFSGFSSKGIPARYNYLRTLSKVKVSQLYILDDYGHNNSGAYYLVGRDGKLNTIQDEICSLIKKFSKNKRIACVGSSKGGTAALMYGIMCFANYVIIGAPQYYIGNYLNTDEHRDILLGICGCIDKESIMMMNNVVKNCILTAQKDKRPEIYLHASLEEHTYQEHIHDMLMDLESCKFIVHKDFGHRYQNHNDVAKYFPLFLLEVIKSKTENRFI